MSIDNVADVSRRVQYVASAAQTVFPYTFPIFDEDDLVVEVDGATQTITTDYTVSGVEEDAGGNVTFTSGMAGGEIITIYSDTSIARTSDFSQNGPNLSAVMNDELDRITVVQQELREGIRRAIRFPMSSEVASADLELSPISAWLERYLYINSAGELEAAAVIDSGTTLTQSVIAGLLTPQTDIELANGVAPVNEQYIPGKIDRYGTNAVPGTTNVATAVQAAFNSGHLVTGDNGITYYCGTTNITIPANTRASLYGVKFKTAVSGNPFLTISGNNVEILGLEIEGNGNGSLTDTDERMISCEGASSAAYKSGLTIRDCHIYESGFYGVYCEFVENVVVEGCHFHDIRHAAFGGQSVTRARVNYNIIHDIGPGSAGNSYGVFFSRKEGIGDLTSQPRPTDCEANGNIVYNMSEWEALDTHTGERITFANNIIRNCLLGIMVGDDSDDYPPRDITITGNIIESDTLSADPYRAIGSGGADASNKARNIVCTGNVVRGYGLDSVDDGAIMFQFTDGLIIADNIIEDSRGVAICVLQGNEDFVVSGNSIRGVRAGVGNASGIYVRQPNQVGHIADNFIDATAEVGIFLVDPSTGVSFGRNRIITSGSKLSGALYGGEGLELEGTVTTDVADILDGDQAQFDITVAGAQIGDYVVGVGCSITTGSLSMTGCITAQDTVTVILQNNSGGAINLASATYTALVRKR